MNRFYYFITLFVLFIISCSGEQEIEIFPSPSLDYFALLKSNNPDLESDIIIDISKQEKKNIDVFIPHLKTDSLIASYSGNFKEAYVDGILQKQGYSVNDFNHAVSYLLVNERGEQSIYTIKIWGANGIPRVIIKTKDGNPVLTKNYVEATMRIDNCPDFGVINIKECKIKGRGNATFGWDKKPYKIKLSERISLFGFPENKEWVLLALWNDKSLLRESVMAEVSRQIGEPFTINTQYVDLFLNDEYRGTYLFVDQVERGDSRVSLQEDGYLIEDDPYYQEESSWFTTDLYGYNYTFKYPKLCNLGDLSYIKNYLDYFERKLNMGADEIEQIIDIDSFARFFIVNELLCNWEPNLYYYLPSRKGKLTMGPLWDFEWSLGLAENGNPNNEWGWYFPPIVPNPERRIWENRKYFTQLIKNKTFINSVKEQWNGIYSQKTKIIERANELAKIIQYSQCDNFLKWNILGSYTSVQLVAFDTWAEEVDYMTKFLNKRFDWCDKYICGL